jgi:hypothetical protein
MNQGSIGDGIIKKTRGQKYRETASLKIKCGLKYFLFYLKESLWILLAKGKGVDTLAEWSRSRYENDTINIGIGRL